VVSNSRVSVLGPVNRAAGALALPAETAYGALRRPLARKQDQQKEEEATTKINNNHKNKIKQKHNQDQQAKIEYGTHLHQAAGA
jgi:hypothetical protein